MRGSWPTPTTLTVTFSSLGHGYMHMFAVYYYLVILALQQAWGLPYADLLELWTIGAALVGLMALPAGWLADRWSASGMMIVFFLGLGFAAVLCGIARHPNDLWIGLCLLGAFAAIYHPVGIPWLVRNAESRGKALGINGIFGSGGVAVAGLVAGTLIDVLDWRAAFILPGIASILTGLLMLGCLRRGLLESAAALPRRQAAAATGDRTRMFAILMLTMFCNSLIYQATQASLPKVLETRVGAFGGQSALGVGMLVALVYGVAAASQVAAGHLADRHSLKTVYASAWLLQIPLLWLAASLGGPAFVVLAALLVILNTGSLPAENILLAGAAPASRQGLAFGAKFVLGFGAAPVAVRVVAYIQERTGEFAWLFVLLSALAVVAALLGLLLPADGRPRAGQPAADVSLAS